MDDLLVRGGHHALSVNLNDPMSHADAAPLSDSPSHQAADLSVKGQVGYCLGQGTEWGQKTVFSGNFCPLHSPF